MQRKQTLSLALTLGQPTHDLNFVSVYEDKNQIVAVLALIAKQDKHGGACAIFITSDLEASMEVDQVNFNAKPVKYYLIADQQKCWIDKISKFEVISGLEKIQNTTSKMREIFSQDEQSNAMEASVKKHRK